MFHRIDIVLIVKSHFKTLRDIRIDNGGLYWRDALTYIILPCLVAFVFAYLKIDINSQVANLIAIIAIFGGFLLNLLAIIYTFLDKIRTENKDAIEYKEKVKYIYASEINANISFCIILSIFSVLLLLVYNMIPVTFYKCKIFFVHQSFLFIIYLALFEFLLTLLMVVSRVFILLQLKK